MIITDEMVITARKAYMRHEGDAVSALRAALTAALATVPGESGVKELEWYELTSPREDGPAEPTGDWEASTLIGEYSVTIDTDDDVKDYPWCAWGVESIGHFATCDEARTAAQADFERRIRSALQPQPSADVEAMRARKDAAYEERNKLVAALARLYPSGTKRTDIPGWSSDWHGCVYIDLPVGQVSWHYHDSQAYLFAGLPAYEGVWDGHDTEEKYRRLAALQPPPSAPAGGEVAELQYLQIIAIVNDCVDRMKKGGESHAMLAKWISEGVNAALANLKARSGE